MVEPTENGSGRGPGLLCPGPTARKARRKKTMNKRIRDNNLRTTVVMVLLVVLLIALVVAVQSARTTFPSAKGKERQQVASSERYAPRAFEKEGDVWVASKIHVANLTPNTTASNDEDPSMSPDGKKVTFASDRDGDFEIYTLDVSSGEVARVTDNAGDDRYPAWSPDGTKLTFWYRRANATESFMTHIDVSKRPTYFIGSR
jgi:dipeptidyl aminopeptidase/acylaminoacyl peptidase